MIHTPSMIFFRKSNPLKPRVSGGVERNRTSDLQFRKLYRYLYNYLISSTAYAKSFVSLARNLTVDKRLKTINSLFLYDTGFLPLRNAQIASLKRKVERER